MKGNISKRFPANVTLDTQTFLNDKKIDGELYALFQELSYVDKEGQTVVSKDVIPSQSSLCEKLGIKTPKTYRAHRDYLIAQGYIIDDEENRQYILPMKEDIFFMIPLQTLRFINDTLKEQVIKVYTYLGQRWKYKESLGTDEKYSFTLKEIGEHIGLKTEGSSRNSQIVTNALLCLSKLGLIEYENYYDQNNGKPVPRMRLTQFNLTIELNG